MTTITIADLDAVASTDGATGTLVFPSGAKNFTITISEGGAPAGEALTGPPPIADKWFWGSGGPGVDAKFHITTSGGTIPGGINAGSNTLPEFVAQFGMYSNTGAANSASAYKVACAPWIVADPGSASAYAFNTVARANAGFDKLMTAGEFDVNNSCGTNYNFSTIGSGVDIHGISVISASDNDISTGLWMHSIGTGKFSNGIVITPQLSLTDPAGNAFQAVGGGFGFIRAMGSWQLGVNLFGATIRAGTGAAFIAPNNSGLGSANAAGDTLIPMVYLDASDRIIIGDNSRTVIIGGQSFQELEARLAALESKLGV